MAGSGPSPPSSLFGKLPVELLEHIVALVKAQDRAFRDQWLDTAGPPTYFLDPYIPDPYDFEAAADVPRGIWGEWYPAGVHALSLCNKQLRRLCAPHLFETTSTRKLNEPAFAFGIIGNDVCRHVKHLKLDTKMADEAVFAVASALVRLPQLHRLTLNGRHLPFFIALAQAEDEFETVARFKDQYAAIGTLRRRALTREVFRGLSDRITHIQVDDASPESVTTILRVAAPPARLKSLTVVDSASASGQDISFLREALSPFSLQELILEGVPPELSITASSTAVLPTITSLALPVLGLHDALHMLKWVDIVMPKLRHLHLDHASMDESSHPNTDTSLSFSHLSHLTISRGASSIPILSLFPTSPITHLDLDINLTLRNSILLRDIVSPKILPSTTRHFHINLACQIPPSDVDIVRAELALRGVSSTFAWRPRRSLAHHNFKEPGVGQEECRSQQKAAIEATLAYAKERLEQSSRTGDWEGMNELAEALRWVRERQVIDSL